MSQDSNIRHPVAEPCQDQQAEKPRDYDMYDSHDLQRWPKLPSVLQDGETTLGEAYRRADSISRNYHFRHKVAGIVPAFGGMFAVLFAIVRLPNKLPFELDLVGGTAPRHGQRMGSRWSLRGIGCGRRGAAGCHIQDVACGEGIGGAPFLREIRLLDQPEAWSDPSDVHQAQLRTHVKAINALELPPRGE